MKTKITTEVRTTRQIELGYDDLRQFLEGKLGRQLTHDVGVKFYIEVPGGGDWSGVQLEIGNDISLFAVVYETEVKQS